MVKAAKAKGLAKVAAAGAKKAASPAGGGGSAGGGNGGGGSGGGGIDHEEEEEEGLDRLEELESPKVKVDASVMAGLHRGMTGLEREAFMGNTKLRSSFVDNTPSQQSYFAGGHRPEGGGGAGGAEESMRRTLSERSSVASINANSSDDGSLR
jgi:hypothetical protein